MGMTHPCPAGCCGEVWEGPAANGDRSLSRAKELSKYLFMPPISTPAANKYTKTDPCVHRVSHCTLVWSFGLLRKAISRMLGKVDGDTGQTHGLVEADGAIGIPHDTREYETNLGHIKLQKVHTFLSHAAAKHLLLVWVVVCTPIMCLHYYLFLHGKIYSHRSDDEDAVTVFDFVSEVHFNLLVDTLAALCAMLMEPDGLAARKHLRLLHLALGPTWEWPDRVATALQVALLIGIAVLWRKVIVYFNSYTWALALAFDTTRSTAVRRAVLEAFFRAEPCCLDMGLCRQLRKAFPRARTRPNELLCGAMGCLLHRRGCERSGRK